MLSIVVQCIRIALLMISIIVQCYGIIADDKHHCAMHWDSIAYAKVSCAMERN